MSNFWPCLCYANHTLCHTVIAYPLQPTLAPAMPTLWSDLLIFVTWHILAWQVIFTRHHAGPFYRSEIILLFHLHYCTSRIHPCTFYSTCLLCISIRKGVHRCLIMIVIRNHPLTGLSGFPLHAKKRWHFVVSISNVTYQCASKMSNGSCRCILHASYN